MSLDKKLYPWADFMTADMTVGTEPGYPTGAYLDLFEERTFASIDNAVGDLRYYVYDPTKHGMPLDKKYPVIFGLHGAGNALAGKLAVNYAGMEMFASPEYQQKLGGAYIVCPLANEHVGENGYTAMTWMTTKAPGDLADYSLRLKTLVEGYQQRNSFVARICGAESLYTASLLALLKEARASFSCAGKTLLTGSSAGGYASWRLLNAAPELFDAAILMAPAYLPSEKQLDVLAERNIPILLCHAHHDELISFDLTIRPHLERYAAMKNVQLFLPELVFNRDGSVASNIAGEVQMGQHCINNAIQNDLKFADGTLMNPELPEGITGWIRANVG